MKITISLGNDPPQYTAADLIKMHPIERVAFALRRFAWKEYGKYTQREADRLRSALFDLAGPGVGLPESLLSGSHDATWRDIISTLPADVLPACRRGALFIARGSARAPITSHMHARIEALFGGGPLSNDIEVTEQERQMTDITPYHERAPVFRLQHHVGDGVEEWEVGAVPFSTHARGTTVFDFGAQAEHSIMFDDLISVAELATGELLTVREFHHRLSRGNGPTNLLMCFEGRRLCWVLVSMLRSVASRVTKGDRAIIREGVNSLLAEPVSQPIVDSLITGAVGNIEIAGGLTQILRRLSAKERAACLEFGSRLPAYGKDGKYLLNEWLRSGGSE